MVIQSKLYRGCGATEAVHTIECGVEGGAKWAGIAAVGTKLFCAPRFASSVLIIDSDCSTKEAELFGELQSLAGVGMIRDGMSFVYPGPHLKGAFPAQ